MAFPLTGILDDFDRADAGDLGANWTANPWNGAEVEPQIISNRAASAGAGVVNSHAWWNVAQYGPDCEVYITLSVTGSQEHGVFFRIQNPVTASADGYRAFHFTDNNYYLYRVDDTVNTQLGASVTQSADADDQVGVAMIGSTYRLYFSNEGAGFVEIATRTDATYLLAGYLGFETGANTSNRQDNFGGGSLEPIASIAWITA